MSFTLSDAPISDSINNGGETSVTWQDWFTRVSDALKGPWGDQSVRITEDLGENAVVNQCYLRYHGDTAFFYLNVTDLDTVAPINLALPDNKLLDGFYTDVIQANVTTKFMQNKTIVIPADTSATYVVFGTFMREK